MTYVEFFDKIAFENISACLTCAPDRVIYIGNSSTQMENHISNYKKVFSGRGKDIEFIFKTVSRSNLENAVRVLSEIVDTYDDCVFDITGGDEILNLALGVVYARCPDRNIQIHRFNFRNNVFADCDKDGVTIYRDPPKLSVDENIRIYGGEVAYGDIDEKKTYKWDLTPDFQNDIKLIWGICKRNVRLWNTQIGVFGAAEKVGAKSEDKLTTVCSRAALDSYLRHQSAKYKLVKGIVADLRKNGLLTRFDDDGTSVTVSYKNAQVKKCLTVAGQALEMKIYLSAKSALGKGGIPVYNDALNGVVIDWDGEFHDENQDGKYDTNNEIDVMLMHDIVPVFISCKNGIVDAAELYKLNTVAERFGGQYSKKILVATALSSLGKNGERLRQRAIDMNIRLLEDVQKMSDEELERKLKTLWDS